TTVSLIVITPEGVVVVDGQDTLELGLAMVEMIKQKTSLPVKYNVIASDHGDHVNSNMAIKKAYPDVRFIASPVSAALLSKRLDIPEIEIVTNGLTLNLGGTEIQVLDIGRGHTGGDLVAYLPESKVLFLGELYLRYVFPAMITGYPSDWVKTINTAQGMDVDWYVPGHGFVEDDDPAVMEADLENALKATEHVISEARRLHAAGHACASEKDCPAAEHADWGPYADWTLFESQSARALARVYMEIEGNLP
ncbi:MAG: MBL fold metallo-hydrolase, partial [Rhodospirillaceae bacterium]